MHGIDVLELARRGAEERAGARPRQAPPGSPAGCRTTRDRVLGELQELRARQRDERRASRAILDRQATVAAPARTPTRPAPALLDQMCPGRLRYPAAAVLGLLAVLLVGTLLLQAAVWATAVTGAYVAVAGAMALAALLATRRPFGWPYRLAGFALTLAPLVGWAQHLLADPGTSAWSVVAFGAALTGIGVAAVIFPAPVAD